MGQHGRSSADWVFYSLLARNQPAWLLSWAVCSGNGGRDGGGINRGPRGRQRAAIVDAADKSFPRRRQHNPRRGKSAIYSGNLDSAGGASVSRTSGDNMIIAKRHSGRVRGIYRGHAPSKRQVALAAKWLSPDGNSYLDRTIVDDHNPDFDDYRPGSRLPKSAPNDA
jgi:hypothetical protein